MVAELRSRGSPLCNEQNLFSIENKILIKREVVAKQIESEVYLMHDSIELELLIRENCFAPFSPVEKI
jgi:hypothetical protein